MIVDELEKEKIQKKSLMRNFLERLFQKLDSEAAATFMMLMIFKHQDELFQLKKGKNKAFVLTLLEFVKQFFFSDFPKWLDILRVFIERVEAIFCFFIRQWRRKKMLFHLTKKSTPNRP